jgi:hypothetical protein
MPNPRTTADLVADFLAYRMHHAMPQIKYATIDGLRITGSVKQT